MNAETFFKHFATFAEAPNGVTKLREMILQLAVQGKLVPQDPKDELATALFEQIQLDRSRLIADGIIRRGKPLPAVGVDELPFQVPASWVWVRFDDVGDWGAGATPNRGRLDYFGGDIKWFKSGELNEAYLEDSEEKITELALKECSLRENRPGDVLVAMYGATIGKVGILNVPATTNQAVCACTCYHGVFNRYLFLMLKAFKSYFISNSSGAAQPNFSKEKIVRTPFPLPPLAEQKRIVSKVDQLMKLCDELESRQTARRESRMRLVGATLDRVVSTSSTAEFPKHVNRLRDQFDRLFDTPTTIPQLRQTILQLAVQGKLVPQDPNDEPVPSGIFNINQLGGGPDRKVFLKAVSNILVPATWALAPLAAVSEAIVDCPHSTPKWTTTGRMCVRTNQFRAGSLDLTDVRFVNDATFLERIQRLRPVANDILYSREGGILGIACRIPEKVELCLGQRMMVIRSATVVDPAFLEMILNSPLITNIAKNRTTGGAAPRVNVATVKAYPIPVPPRAEQKRIVEKANYLMKLCDDLESQLFESETQSTQLLSAAVHHLLNASSTV